MSVALALLSAHLLADFPLQTDDMAADKLNCSIVRTAHVGVHSVLTLVCLALIVPVPVASTTALAVSAMHWLIDTRRWAKPKDGFELYPIAVDQSLHIASLFVVSVVLL